MAPLLTATDLAEALGLSAYTVLAHARSGRLPHVRIGSRVRFDPGLVARLVEQGYNSHHVPAIAETEKAPQRDDRANVVGRVVGGNRRRRKARAPISEPRTMRECFAEICEGLVVGTPEAVADANGVDVQTLYAEHLVTSPGGPLVEEHEDNGGVND